MNLHRIAAVVAKETRELSRDPITVGISLLMPLVMLFLFGYAVTLDIKDIAMGVLDRDTTPASRGLTDAFVQSGYFRVVRVLRSTHDIDAALQRGSVDLVLVIPERFQATIERGESPAVQLLLDGTYSDTAQVVAGYADTIVRSYGGDPGGHVRVEMRVWYNAEMRSANYVVPGLFAVILMAFPPLLTALAVVREKETGAIQQIFASPLTASEFVAGKLIPYGGVAFIQILMVMTAGFFWFDIPFRGNAGFLLFAASIYVLCTVGLGLLISTMARRQVTAMLLALILTMMPSMLFSGFVFPIFTMPYMFQLYTFLFPARYFVEVSRGIVLKGSGPEQLWANIGLLVAYTVIVFVISAARLRKKVA
jgi:drug efflux transport system permease protein